MTPPQYPGDLAIAAIMCLATWRFTHLFKYETGPFQLVSKLRGWTGVYQDSDGVPYAFPDGNVFECFLCLSVWVGLVVGAVMFAPWGWLALVPFAISAVAIWAEHWYNGKS